MKDKSKNTSDSDSGGNESEHELLHYVDDRIKLMQVSLKLIKPKKLAAMIPDCIKDLPMTEVKELLLDELLGISKKRLKCILAGEPLNAETSSSSESEIAPQPEVDIISLDDITDSTEIYVSDENCMEIKLSEKERLELEAEKSKQDKNTKLEGKRKKLTKTKVKKEKIDKNKKKKKKPVQIKEEKVDREPEDPVMSVLNLLELQARARAIRSQLANEALSESKPEQSTSQSPQKPLDDDENSNSSVIFISPKNTPVVTVPSDSEIEKISASTEELVEIQINDQNKEVNSPEKRTDEDDNDILIVTEESILDKSEGEFISEKSQERNTPEKEDDDIENDVTWKSRWLESSKIKSVMRTTKLYNNLRQSRKQKNTAEENTQTDITLEQIENSNNENVT